MEPATTLARLRGPGRRSTPRPPRRRTIGRRRRGCCWALRRPAGRSPEGPAPGRSATIIGRGGGDLPVSRSSRPPDRGSATILPATSPPFQSGRAFGSAETPMAAAKPGPSAPVRQSAMKRVPPCPEAALPPVVAPVRHLQAESGGAAVEQGFVRKRRPAAGPWPEASGCARNGVEAPLSRRRGEAARSRARSSSRRPRRREWSG